MRIYREKIKKIKIAGTVKSTESIRSKMPPCPGMIFPESLMPVERFIMDSIKSPNVPKTTAINPIANIFHVHNPVKGAIK